MLIPGKSHSRVERCNCRVSIETLVFTRVRDRSRIAGRGMTAGRPRRHPRPMPCPIATCGRPIDIAGGGEVNYYFAVANLSVHKFFLITRHHFRDKFLWTCCITTDLSEAVYTIWILLYERKHIYKWSLMLFLTNVTCVTSVASPNQRFV